MPRSVTETYDIATGAIVRTYEPWSIETFRAELADVRWRRETAGIIVGPYHVSTMRDEAGGIENQKHVWASFESTLKSRPSQESIVYKNPETGTLAEIPRAHVFRICDCFAWYVEVCFRVEMHFWNLAATASLDSLVETIQSTAPNAPWPQRVFDLEAS